MRRHGLLNIIYISIYSKNVFLKNGEKNEYLHAGFTKTHDFAGSLFLPGKLYLTKFDAGLEKITKSLPRRAFFLAAAHMSKAAFFRARARIEYDF